MVKPTSRVLVNWDDDGLWNEANEDLVADVESLDWLWGIDQQTGYAFPGELNLTLRNETHKYSPPNVFSPHVEIGLEFDGVSGDVDFGSPAVFDNIFAGGATVEAWITPNSDGGFNSGRVFSKNDAGGDSFWYVATNSQVGLSMKLELFHDTDFINGRWRTTDPVLTVGRSYHIAVSYDSDSVLNDPIIYIEGVSVAITEATTPVGNPISDAASNLLAGNRTFDDTTFDGRIRELRVWSDIRTPAEILSNYWRALVGNEAGLVGYWRVDEGSGSTLDDLTSNNNDGTITTTGWGSGDNLQTGRRVWLQLAYPYDDFDAADADISGRSFSNDSNFTWTKQTGGGSFNIVSNEVKAVIGTKPTIYTTEFHDADAHFGFKYQRNTNALGGCVLRLIDANDHLRIRFGDTSTVLENLTGGDPSNIRSGDALTAGADYWIEIEMHGPSIRLFATRLDSASEVRKEILDGGGTALNQSATLHGLWHDADAVGEDTDRWDDFGGWRSLFYGKLEEIVPVPEERLCRLICRDDLEWLRETDLFRLINASNVRSDTIVDNILTWAGFPTNDRELDTGATLIASNPKVVWIRAARALQAVQDEEDGLIYQDGIGYVRLEKLGHRSVAGSSHLTSRATISDALASAPYFSGVRWRDGSEFVENFVTFLMDNPPDQGLQTIWTLRDVPGIVAGANIKLLARSRTYEVVDSLVTPVATTDYTGNTQADGGGADRTSSLVVTLDTANFEGLGTLVTITNNHGTDLVYVTLAQLRANNSHDSLEGTFYQTEDATSQTQHEKRAKEVVCNFIDNFSILQTSADSRLARKKDVKTLLEVDLSGHGDYRNLLQLVHRVLGDRLSVAYSYMGIDEDFFLESVRLVLDPGKSWCTWELKGV